MPELSFKISYHHGDAAQGRLDLYDAGISIQGLAKALSITTHALLNDGAIRKQGDKAEGARIFINPSRKGSFEEIITIFVSDPVAASVGTSILAAAFWDLIKWTWSHTVDKEYEPETPFVRRLADRREPFIGEISESLEIPLEQLHRPIKQHAEMEISISRPRVGEILRLDQDTMLNVSLSTDPDITENIVGNVTRYNILSGYGRFFSDDLQRTVSFKITENVPFDQRELITWSIDQAQRRFPGKVVFDAKIIKSARGVVKRYLVHEIRKA